MKYAFLEQLSCF